MICHMNSKLTFVVEFISLPLFWLFGKFFEREVEPSIIIDIVFEFEWAGRNQQLSKFRLQDL